MLCKCTMCTPPERKVGKRYVPGEQEYNGASDEECRALDALAVAKKVFNDPNRCLMGKVAKCKCTACEVERAYADDFWASRFARFSGNRHP